jgi:hypothetical protein
VVAVLLLAGGCVRVNVDADGLVDRYAGPYIAGPDEDDAVELARQAVASEGLDLDDYELSVRQVQRDHWVMFDRRNSASKPLAWPYHFSVRVGSDGSTKVFKDR